MLLSFQVTSLLLRSHWKALNTEKNGMFYYRQKQIMNLLLIVFKNYIFSI